MAARASADRDHTRTLPPVHPEASHRCGERGQCGTPAGVGQRVYASAGFANPGHRSHLNRIRV
jgi:hypothetical protein